MAKSTLLSRILNFRSKKQPPLITEAQRYVPEDKLKKYRAMADGSTWWNGNGGYPTVFPSFYNGENNLGALGDAQRLYADHQLLAARSWELYLKSDIAHTVISRKIKWVISDGLKLQVEPDAEVFNMLGIPIDIEKHNAKIEALWNNFIRSTQCDYNNRLNFAQLQVEQYKNRVVGGDVLAILRLKDGVPTVQLIDGTHVMTPIGFPLAPTDWNKIDNLIGFERYNPENGNPVRNGVEVDKNDFSVVAFHVRTWITSYNYIRIEKYNKRFGTIQANLLGGLNYRLDDYRGIPELTPNMENIKQISDYKAAIIQGAVSRANVAFSIEHELGGTGENPLAERMVNSIPQPFDNVDGSTRDLGPVAEGKLIANNFTAETKKTMLNMPLGAHLKFHEAKQEAKYAEFLNPNLLAVCGTFGIPVEVAYMKYEGSFSSSRAGLKDWEHTLHVDRHMAAQFNQMFYDWWLDAMVLQGKLDLPIYRKALFEGNQDVLNAYRNAHWVGANVPHIDPEKEARTERLKLGALGANLPLTDQASATMALNGGNSIANTRQFARELDEAAKLKIPIPVPVEQTRITE
jgi:capsid protein